MWSFLIFHMPLHATFGYLDFATQATRLSAIDDFGATTLRLRYSTVATRYGTCLWPSAVRVSLLRVIYHPNTVLLVLIKDKTLLNKTNTEAQLIVNTIAVFQFHNTKREALDQPVLGIPDYPCLLLSPCHQGAEQCCHDRSVSSDPNLKPECVTPVVGRRLRI